MLLAFCLYLYLACLQLYTMAFTGSYGFNLAITSIFGVTVDLKWTWDYLKTMPTTSKLVQTTISKHSMVRATKDIRGTKEACWPAMASAGGHETGVGFVSLLVSQSSMTRIGTTLQPSRPSQVSNRHGAVALVGCKHIISRPLLPFVVVSHVVMWTKEVRISNETSVPCKHKLVPTIKLHGRHGVNAHQYCKRVTSLLFLLFRGAPDTVIGASSMSTTEKCTKNAHMISFQTSGCAAAALLQPDHSESGSSSTNQALPFQDFKICPEYLILSIFGDT